MIEKIIEFFKNLFGAKKEAQITPPSCRTYAYACA